MLMHSYVDSAGATGIQRAAAASLAFGLIALGALGAGSAPGIKPLRYEEDYRYLQDPAQRTGERFALESLKFIPLRKPDGAYASIGGEVRLQYKILRYPNFGAYAGDSDGYLLQRYLLHGDLHLEDFFRLFAQLQSAIASFEEGMPGPVDEDRLAFHQLFMDFARRTSAETELTLRLGRQEMLYGSQRIIGVREGPNVRRAFDAVRLLLATRNWRIDGFVARPVETDRGIFDDGSEAGAKFWGVYASRPLGQFGGKADVYVLGYERPNAIFNQGRGDERRHSVGFRLFGVQGGVDFNFEALAQWGRFARGNIRAWTVASDTGYSTGRFRLGLMANVSSGDRDPDDVDLGTFNPLFPRGNYFGESAVIGPLNLVDVHPLIQFSVTPSLRLEAGCTWYWRQSLGDGVYGGALNLVRGADGSQERFIGREWSLLADWKLNRHVSFILSYAHIVAGAFLEEKRPTSDLDYVSLQATYRF